MAETGSMGKAAERLNISQPSVSKAIADMEHVMQVRLFDRTGHGVETTPYGLALVQRGTNAFDELRQALRDIEILADPTGGEVSIGCPEAIASGFLGEVLTRFSLQFPRVVVNVEQADNVTHEYQLLRDRQVDLLLGSITMGHFCLPNAGELKLVRRKSHLYRVPKSVALGPFPNVGESNSR